MPRSSFVATEIRHAAMIKFPAHMTKAQCDDILLRMLKAGYCETTFDGKPPTAQAYEPEMTSPCLYFP